MYFYDLSHCVKKSSHIPKSMSNEDCLKFYLRHYRQVLILEGIKSHVSDFYHKQSIEDEISVGLKKCEFWYKRGDFSNLPFVSKLTELKVAIAAIDFSKFV